MFLEMLFDWETDSGYPVTWMFQILDDEDLYLAMYRLFPVKVTG